jgi:hypothetical protein
MIATVSACGVVDPHHGVVLSHGLPSSTLILNYAEAVKVSV